MDLIKNFDRAVTQMKKDARGDAEMLRVRVTWSREERDIMQRERISMPGWEVAAAVVLYLLACPGKASAYIDPGTGSMMLQLLAAGLVSAALVFRKSLGRFFALFRKARK